LSTTTRWCHWDAVFGGWRWRRHACELTKEAKHKHPDKGRQAAGKVAVEDHLRTVIAGADVVRTSYWSGNQEASVCSSLPRLHVAGFHTLCLAVTNNKIHAYC
jgi:hypothetical protein